MKKILAFTALCSGTVFLLSVGGLIALFAMQFKKPLRLLKKKNAFLRKARRLRRKLLPHR